MFLTIFVYIHLGFFELVNLLIDAAQAVGTGCPVEFSTGGLCDLAEWRFINVDINILILNTIGSLERIWCLALSAYADGVDADAEGLGDFSSGDGVDVSAVVGAVGQQDDDFGLGLGVLDAAHGIG